MNRAAVAVVLLGLLGGLWHLAEGPPRPVDPGPGVLAPDQPIQQDLPAGTAPLRHGDFVLHPQARFEITARLLSSERYRFDAGAALSPIDWALGWGQMSNGAVLAQLDIGQGNRFFTYRWPDAPPIPAAEIVRSATNVHLIPADDAVWRQLKRTAPGRVVRLEGLLVNAVGDDGYRWNSSLSREDTGNGACELIYVQAVRVLR